MLPDVHPQVKNFVDVHTIEKLYMHIDTHIHNFAIVGIACSP